MSHSKPNLVLYCAGGSAINIAKTFHQPSSGGQAEPGFASIQTVYIDTSRSNIPDNIKEGFFLIQGTTGAPVDGSGKVRDTNYKAVSLAMPEILHRHKPGSINVVLHSASGGKLVH